MSQISCARCSRVLEYSGERPSFCGYCGQSLQAVAGSETVFVATPPPDSDRGDLTIDYISRPGVPARDPDRVKGYRLIRQLGRGGMGTVFEAEDSRFGRRVALKIIAPGYVESTDAVERFRQEGRLASSLSHPRCVFVLEADEDDDGRPFIAMELMTGDTLQDLVEKGGPLPVGEAVAKILDVIEGLAEAHRLGLIHRDVKPSNCFLDAEGRVKVGDFGLSKSQVGSAHLTRTGSFLGTPLYASPEQIKVEPLDGRTDVYSTSATLFFLLTGRAPFDRGDAAATMARIVSDPAPSAREVRPEVPIGLDRAVRKGLERDLDRRHADLDQFRAALLPFLPGQVPSARLVQRVGAYLFDYFLLGLPMLALFFTGWPPWVILAVNSVVWLTYFALGDGIWGGSPGKRLLRLRVTTVEGREPAGPGRSAIRALVFFFLAEFPLEFFLDMDSTWEGWPVVPRIALLLAAPIGLALLVMPMRARRDFRPLHDLVAGTRVVALSREERRRSAGARRVLGRDRGSVTRPIGVLQTVGPYKVRGAVRWEPDRRVVTGEDPSLGREAWIVIRPKGSPAPEPARREVSRATRPRWLAGGEQAEGRWDAYIAPAGSPLADLAGAEGLSWHDARPILEDLADELTAACAEGTLPPGLTVDQVWVQPDGRAILVDPLGIARSSTESEAVADDERALTLLRKAAALALEGGRRRVDEVPKEIRSPVPIHARATLDRLLGGAEAHASVAAFRADLETSRHQPTEVAPGQRATQVGILAAFLAFGLGLTYAYVYVVLVGNFAGIPIEGGELSLPQFKASLRIYDIAFFPAVLTALTFATRDGFSLKLAGLGLVRWDGRKAPRWRCAWRTFLVWLPMAALLFASIMIRAYYPIPDWPRWVPFGVALALLPAYAALAMIFRSCGPHDYLSGLRVVPR